MNPQENLESESNENSKAYVIYGIQLTQSVDLLPIPILRKTDFLSKLFTLSTAVRYIYIHILYVYIFHGYRYNRKLELEANACSYYVKTTIMHLN